MMRKSVGKIIALIFIPILGSLVFSCSQPLGTREKATLGGAGLGAATGAIIGAAVGNPAAGAAIGGALGGVTGAAVGDRLQRREGEIAGNARQIEEQRQEISRNRRLLDELKNRNLEARETERGVVVNLPDVLFQFGRADLAGDASGRVVGIADALNNQATERRISVEGHTDSVGTETDNQALSERRAQSVANALSSAGVSEDRITTKGYGERYPVSPNAKPDGSDSPDGRAKNRRVEVVIEN